MATYVRGDIIWAWVPNTSDFDGKPRPALVLAELSFRFDSNDYLVAMMTTRDVNDPFKIACNTEDLSQGKLEKRGWVRPLHILRVAESEVRGHAGTLKREKMKEVVDFITGLLSDETR